MRICLIFERDSSNSNGFFDEILQIRANCSSEIQAIRRIRAIENKDPFITDVCHLFELSWGDARKQKPLRRSNMCPY